MARQYFLKSRASYLFLMLINELNIFQCEISDSFRGFPRKVRKFLRSCLRKLAHFSGGLDAEGL